MTLGTSIAAPGINIPVSEAKKRVTRITTALTLVQMIPSLPIQFALLQHCVGMQRLTFSLRNNPTNVIEAEVRLFDQAMVAMDEAANMVSSVHADTTALEGTLAQQHALIRQADEYADLFTHAALVASAVVAKAMDEKAGDQS